MRFWLPLAICSIVACSSKRDPAPAASPPLVAAVPASVAPLDVADMHFAWPAPGSVSVIEKTVKKGKRATMSYRLNLARAGTDLHVTYADFKFLELEGFDLKAARNASQLAQLEAMAGAIPTLRVASSGALVELIGFDKTLETALQVVLATAPPKDHAQVRAMMSGGAMRQAIEQKAGDPWRGWVEAWLVDDLPAAGTSAEFEDDTGAALVIENRGRQSNGTLRLEMRRTRRIPAAEVQSLLSELPDEVTDAVSDIVQTSQVWVETTRTMQPQRAYLEASLDMVTADGSKKSRVESHDYRFSW